VPTKRYWYDFDNEYKVLIGNAICTRGYLNKTGKKLHDVRFDNRRTLTKGWKNIIEFEYSGCYSVEHMLRKFYTSTHTGLGYNDLVQSLRCNHRPTKTAENQIPENNERDLFETVTLNEYNSPKYVRENLNLYKTNAIDKNYKENRKLDYPQIFTAGYHISRFMMHKQKFFKKKFRALRHKLKLR
jgi:hypothetical protein